jgi:hypothetical protein
LVYRSSAYSTSTSTTDAGLSGSLSLSLDNSYVFASPLRAKAGGEKIRITVFILDGRGLGISGKNVSIGGGNESMLQITPIQPVTDGQGRATFDISSTASGTYIIQATVDGTNLTQKADISFD